MASFHRLVLMSLFLFTQNLIGEESEALSGEWMPKTDILYYKSKSDSSSDSYQIKTFNPSSRATQVLVDFESLFKKNPELKKFPHFVIGPREKRILFTQTLPARSVKTGGDFFLFDIAEKTLLRVTNGEHGQVNINFSPNGNYVSFVRDFNLYVYDIHAQTIKQMTMDGHVSVQNGMVDWVYEEEFGIIDAYTWSPDEKYIGLYQSDVSAIPAVPFDMDYENADPVVRFIRYPKAGSDNSSVKIGVADVQSGELRWTGLETSQEGYIPQLKWQSPNRLLVAKMNRLQNQYQLFEYHTVHQTLTEKYWESARTWIDVPDLQILDSNQFLLTSEKTGYRHLYVVKKGKIRPLTKGKWNVNQILFSTPEKVVFSSSRDNIANLQVFDVSVQGKKVTRMTEQEGYHSISFAPSGEIYKHTFQSSSLRPKTVVRSQEKVLAEQQQKPESYNAPSTEFMEIKNGDHKIHLSLTKASNFDAQMPHPVLIYIYGGPGSQVVLNQWMWSGEQGAFYRNLIENHNYVLVRIDGTGTAGRGRDYVTKVYRDLGHYESEDLIFAIDYLRALPFVDSENVSLWGWSYGGYLTAFTAAKAGNRLKSAISVAPVTNWRYYDTIYTERFMGLPHYNASGYLESSPLTHMESLSAKFLLVHGSGDDNVHIQNSQLLAKKLLELDKDFLYTIYPNRTHSIREGQNDRKHLYRLMENFLIH